VEFAREVRNALDGATGLDVRRDRTHGPLIEGLPPKVC
jgi:hypothetical protein